ncbi:mechanosensitive ion channel family protein [Aliiglaciecola sp. LCG003]|uniref:mechanosensitive ion channel family protein n=1 Tax=Aliiglaciecola sp. LCG003 TaxID=3053655 RepID=UPI002572A0B7|nr:mechanosensitive ion channel family protein [Aliiglaciecola sp. LCG003]WJG10117.1 mechanosensitive ion channel family protein [Aliiglaciecola sp. LCG003]
MFKKISGFLFICCLMASPVGASIVVQSSLLVSQANSAEIMAIAQTDQPNAAQDDDLEPMSVVEPHSLEQETSIIWREAEQYWQAFLASLPMIVIGFVLFVIIFLAARPLSELLVKPLRFVSSSQLIQVVVRRLVSILIILFGLYLFLRFAGLSEFAVAILSGTGVMGLIIGFAFKDIAENFISSLLLSIQKPFKIDDVIEVDGRLGVVKQVTARATTLVDFDGDHIQIPNATVYKNIIRNLTANPKSRGKFVIGIGYDSSIIESQKIALTVLNSTEAVLADPEPQVLVDVLASSTINLKVYFWINSHEHSLLKVSSFLMRAIMRELEKNGISMPDDAREIIFPQGITVHQAAPATETQGKDNPAQIRRSLIDEAILDDTRQNLDDYDEDDGEGEDLSSDAEDIRQQAKEARDPEKGENIL